jgi:hypothetical protein
MITIPAFDAPTWFGNFTEGAEPIAGDQLQPVLEFTLLWNLFEREIHNRFVRVSGIREHVNQSYERDLLDGESYQPHVEFFRSRYPEFEEEGYLADRLLPESRKHIHADLRDTRLVQDVLSGKSGDTNNVVYALLFIAYRVRNNLFHGEKDVYTLHLQKDLFSTVNSVLATYLQQTCRQLSKG